MSPSTRARTAFQTFAFLGVSALFFLSVFSRNALYCDFGIPILGIGTIAPGLILAAIAAHRRSPSGGLIASGYLLAGAALCVTFWTLGELYHGAFKLLLFTPALLFAAAWAARPSRGNQRRARRTAVLLVLLLVPHQLWLGTRWYLMRQEAVRIIDRVQTIHQSTGQYPPNLDGYQWHHPRHAHRFTYRSTPADDPTVSYWLVTPSISHWYSQRGGHGYYPD